MLTQDYLDECQSRGDSDWEERYKNDARWAMQIALDREGLITRIKRGSYHSELAGNHCSFMQLA
jgi:hypothetical protein